MRDIARQVCGKGVRVHELPTLATGAPEDVVTQGDDAAMEVAINAQGSDDVER